MSEGTTEAPPVAAAPEPNLPPPPVVAAPAAEQPPSPPVVVAPEPKPPSVDDLRAEMAREVEALRRVREEAQAEMRARVEAARWDHLRRMGLQHLTREQALVLAPAVDATTLEGQAALDAWRASNPSLFATRRDPAALLEQSKARILPAPETSRQYGPRWQQETVERVMARLHGGG